MSRFSETLLEHARHPRNCRRDAEADRVGRASFGGRPPEVEVYLRLEGVRICSASFYAAGCGVTVGACSALIELIEGRDLAEAAQLDASLLAEALDGVPGDKRHSLEVAVAALRAAIAWPQST